MCSGPKWKSDLHIKASAISRSVGWEILHGIYKKIIYPHLPKSWDPNRFQVNVWSKSRELCIPNPRLTSWNYGWPGNDFLPAIQSGTRADCMLDIPLTHLLKVALVSMPCRLPVCVRLVLQTWSVRHCKDFSMCCNLLGTTSGLYERTLAKVSLNASK